MIYIVGKGWGEGTSFVMDHAIAAFLTEEEAEAFLGVMNEANQGIGKYGIFEVRIMEYLAEGYERNDC